MNSSKIKNRYCVPQKQWRKWDDRSRAMFNEVNGRALIGLEVGKTNVAPDTVAWNAAWIAADKLKEMV